MNVVEYKLTTFDEYDKQALGTDISPHTTEYYMLALAGEVGEACNEFKKVLRDKEGLIDEASRVKILHELGDSLWYLSRLCNHLGTDLEEVAIMNLLKLKERYKK